MIRCDRLFTRCVIISLAPAAAVVSLAAPAPPQPLPSLPLTFTFMPFPIAVVQTDTRRSRAIARRQVEAAATVATGDEIGAAEAEASASASEAAAWAKEYAGTQRYYRFLCDTVAAGPSSKLGARFDDPLDLIRRYATLVSSNKDLQSQAEELSGQLDRLRTSTAAAEREASNALLQLQAKLLQAGARLDAVKSECIELEAAQDAVAAGKARDRGVAGQTVTSIRQLLARVKHTLPAPTAILLTLVKAPPHEHAAYLPQALSAVGERLSDLMAIVEEYPQWCAEQAAAAAEAVATGAAAAASPRAASASVSISARRPPGGSAASPALPLISAARSNGVAASSSSSSPQQQQQQQSKTPGSAAAVRQASRFLASSPGPRTPGSGGGGPSGGTPGHGRPASAATVKGTGTANTAAVGPPGGFRTPLAPRDRERNSNTTAAVSSSMVSASLTGSEVTAKAAIHARAAAAGPGHAGAPLPPNVYRSPRAVGPPPGATPGSGGRGPHSKLPALHLGPGPGAGAGHGGHGDPHFPIDSRSRRSSHTSASGSVWSMRV